MACWSVSPGGWSSVWNQSACAPPPPEKKLSVGGALPLSAARAEPAVSPNAVTIAATSRKSAAVERGMLSFRSFTTERDNDLCSKVDTTRWNPLASLEFKCGTQARNGALRGSGRVDGAGLGAGPGDHAPAGKRLVQGRLGLHRDPWRNC